MMKDETILKFQVKNSREIICFSENYILKGVFKFFSFRK